jgi:hypothetical protein
MPLLARSAARVTSSVATAAASSRTNCSTFHAVPVTTTKAPARRGAEGSGPRRSRRITLSGRVCNRALPELTSVATDTSRATPVAVTAALTRACRPTRTSLATGHPPTAVSASGNAPAHAGCCGRRSAMSRITDCSSPRTDITAARTWRTLSRDNHATQPWCRIRRRSASQRHHLARDGHDESSGRRR